MAFTSKTLPLEQRVEALRGEIDAFIDARVAELRKQYELPETWLRADLLRGQCLCAAYLRIQEASKKDNAA